MKPSTAPIQRFLATRLPRDTFGRVVAFLMVVAIALLLGYWLAKLTAPRPVARLPATQNMARAPSTDAALRLFGLVDTAAAGPANISLTGVFATADGRGFATFRMARGPVAALAGQEVLPGVTLARIGTDHVVLRGASGEQRIELTKRRPEAATAVREER
jgi:hypothetical protein